MDDANLTDRELILVLAERVKNALEQWGNSALDHETRIRKLERIVWIALGVGAASGGTVGGIVASILNGISH